MLVDKFYSATWNTEHLELPVPYRIKEDGSWGCRSCEKQATMFWKNPISNGLGPIFSTCNEHFVPHEQISKELFEVNYVMSL